ncbi:hypothetical protein V6N13_040177 [Hibiscus sabdariffa]|uniref:Uncharacterized protein n=1 Tax=Hibiscus sabdariffa TaxID=183260 RepID=A0ABR2ST95_9ROSI
MGTTEEFSFPTTADLYPCGIESPPLWHRSPAESPHRKAKGKQEEDDKGSKPSDKAGAEGDEEEKMDMLWEDFNEELGGGSRGRSSEEGMKLSKPSGSGGMFCPSPRRAGVLVFIRVLRKLFLLHNSHGSVC